MTFYPSLGDEQLQNLSPFDTPAVVETANVVNSGYTALTMPTLHADAHRYWILIEPVAVATEIVFITNGDTAPLVAVPGWRIPANTPVAFGGERGFRHDVRPYLKLASGGPLTVRAMFSWPQTAPR